MFFFSILAIIFNLKNKNKVPVILHRTVAPDVEFALWQITENWDELVQLYNHYDSNLSFLESYRLEPRKKQTLSARLALYFLLKQFSPLRYTENGKPVLESGFISLSHTQDLASAVFSKKYPVGIDTEKVSDKILRIYPKFMSDTELEHLELTPKNLHLYWGAKEAMYKMYDAKGLIFQTDLSVQFNTAEEGQGEIHLPQGLKEVMLSSYLIQNTVTVVAYSL